MNQIKELTEKIKKFRDERDWMQFHNHKDMALSLCLEAAEVLEHFQWKTSEEVEVHVTKFPNEISEELADVACYLFELADNLGINLATAIERKIEINAQKYPIEKAKGNMKKYDQL